MTFKGGQKSPQRLGRRSVRAGDAGDTGEDTRVGEDHEKGAVANHVMSQTGEVS